VRAESDGEREARTCHGARQSGRRQCGHACTRWAEEAGKGPGGHLKVEGVRVATEGVGGACAAGRQHSGVEEGWASRNGVGGEAWQVRQPAVLEGKYRWGRGGAPGRQAGNKARGTHSASSEAWGLGA
jgi:hypothetical protein